jgi:hypothetical protein
VPGTDIPDRSQLNENLGGCPAPANRQLQLDFLRSGSELHDAAADFSYRK